MLHLSLVTVQLVERGAGKSSTRFMRRLLTCTNTEFQVAQITSDC